MQPDPEFLIFPTSMTIKETNGFEPQDLVLLIWRTGQLMDMLPVSGWMPKHLPGPLAKALGLDFNVLSPKRILKGTLAVPQSLPWTVIVRREEQKAEECLIRTIMEDQRAKMEIIYTHGMSVNFPSTVGKLHSYYRFELSKNSVKCKYYHLHFIRGSKDN